MYKLHQITWCQNYQFVFGSVCNRYTYHYYKMWVQFTSPHSLDLWIHSKSSEITWHTGTSFVVYSWQWVVQVEACVCMTCIVVVISAFKGYPIFLSYVVVIVLTSSSYLIFCSYVANYLWHSRKNLKVTMFDMKPWLCPINVILNYLPLQYIMLHLIKWKVSSGGVIEMGNFDVLFFQCWC
jgi:hypothetical protein